MTKLKVIDLHELYNFGIHHFKMKSFRVSNCSTNIEKWTNETSMLQHWTHRVPNLPKTWNLGKIEWESRLDPRCSICFIVTLHIFHCEFEMLHMFYCHIAHISLSSCTCFIGNLRCCTCFIGNLWCCICFIVMLHMFHWEFEMLHMF
jgi:hypothetical protein